MTHFGHIKDFKSTIEMSVSCLIDDGNNNNNAMLFKCKILIGIKFVCHALLPVQSAGQV
jgi:hypothetical protein